MEQRDIELGEQYVDTTLRLLGVDTSDPNTSGTPLRIIRAWDEMTSGRNEDPRRHLERVFPVDHQDMVVLDGIRFNSLCEHHFLPFHGIAAIGYIPSGKVVGISKLARMLDGYARRWQVQERLATQVADAIEEVLSPKGVAVLISGHHTCIGTRGAAQPTSMMKTSIMRGLFKDDNATRSEFMQLCPLAVQGR